MSVSLLTGDLERAVMERLWVMSEPQTVREVHAALPGRKLAYTTVMTVLGRLTNKRLVEQHRDGRAFRYAPACTRSDMVAGLMLDALHQATGDTANRVAAILQFVELVGGEEVSALRGALRNVQSRVQVLQR